MKTATTLAATLALAAIAQTITVQTATAQVSIDNSTGQITKQTGILTIQTGPNQNNSGILNPVGLIEQRQERTSQVLESRLAPNTLELSFDAEKVRAAIRSALDLSDRAQIGDIVLTQTGTLASRPGNAAFASVVENLGTGEFVAVEGDRVKIGPDGDRLPTIDSMSAILAEGDVIRLSFQHIQEDEGDRYQSAVTITADGQVAIEDVPVDYEGFAQDNDFNDSAITELGRGFGEVQLTEVSQYTLTTTDKLELTRNINGAHAWLSPNDRDGSPAAAAELSLNSDGELGAIAQLAPIGNPNRPTLLGASGAYRPWAADGSEVIRGGLNVTQIISSTHRAEASSQLPLTNASPLIGPGDSAYRNTGGAVLRYENGSYYVQQWSEGGTLGELAIPADGFIEAVPALVANGEELGLPMGELLAIAPNGTITGGHQVIELNSNPENFYLFGDVYGIEDTLTFDNPVVEKFEGDRIDGTVDFNDGYSAPATEIVYEQAPNQFGVYTGASLTIGAGQQVTSTETSTLTTTTKQQIDFDVDSDGQVDNVRAGAIASNTTSESDRAQSTEFALGNIGVEVVGGVVWHFSDNAWQKGASNARAEIYTGTDSGVRASVDSYVSSAIALTADAVYQVGDGAEGSVGVAVVF